MPETVIANLHTEPDSQRNSAAIRRMLILFGALTLVAILMITASLIWRSPTTVDNPRERASQVITIAVSLVLGAALIFLWGMKLTPRLAYRKYLRELHSGLSREVHGVVTDLNETTTFRDGLTFYGMIVNVGDVNDPEDDRLLYWDAQLGRPDLAAGDTVSVRAHGNDIMGMTKEA